jgi:phosphoinositide-3-kinase regulatory subunit 4
MGQGYSLTTLPAGSATIDVPELSDLEFEKSLGNARFMKCIRARRKEGLVVAKIVMKPSPNKNWDNYVHELSGKSLLYALTMVSRLISVIVERKELSDIPNALGYHRIQQTSMAGYLVRQYIHSSLYDRLRYKVLFRVLEVFRLISIVLGPF